MTMMGAAVFRCSSAVMPLAGWPSDRLGARRIVPLLVLLMGGTTRTTAIGVLFCRPYRRAATIALAGTGLARVAKS